MRRAWLWAFVFFNAACNAGGSTWAAEPPPATPAEPPKHPRMQVMISPMDDPASCVEGPVTLPAGEGATAAAPSPEAHGGYEPTTAGPDGPELGRLPPEQIQALVRQHYRAFGHCYDAGLARNSRLKGRLAIWFVIDKEGRVKHSRIQQNDLPDCRVAQCVRDEMRRIHFPAPEGGIVTVIYPIMFQPG